jgi:hypothetical protein
MRPRLSSGPISDSSHTANQGHEREGSNEVEETLEDLERREDNAESATINASVDIMVRTGLRPLPWQDVVAEMANDPDKTPVPQRTPSVSTHPTREELELMEDHEVLRSGDAVLEQVRRIPPLPIATVLTKDGLSLRDSMPYEVLLSPQALRRFRSMDASLQEQTVRKLLLLAQERFPAGCRKIAENRWRIRICNHSMSYFSKTTSKKRIVLDIEDRSQLYLSR